MPRINQLPVASSVAQTDVLAIDTTDKTYKVPRSVLAPAPYIATIPTGQWSGSGSDYYITVTASNVTADAMLYPFYDNASDALLNGPVWVIPADGSFTIHTSAIPSGTVTISVLLAGIVGEAQYQVLADVYSRAQVDTIVSQSTARFSTASISIDRSNNTSFSFSGLNAINDSTIFKHGLLVWGIGNSTINMGLSLIFIDTSGSVTINNVAGTARTFTGTISNGVLTITANATVYGGLKLIWLT